MKKLVFATLGVAGLMAFTSCSQEDLSINPGGDGVTFTIELPRGVQSRGNFGDGTDAGDRATLNNLQYTVYEVVNGTTSTTPVFSDTKSGAFAGSQTTETVTIPLAKGKSYQVVFYADDSTNSFASYSNGVVSVDYAEAASNVAGEDAFIGKSTQFTVDGSYTESVTLKRPFAQLNWGTDDTDAKVLTDVINSLTGTVKITSGLYTQFDILAGNVVGTSAVNDENGTSFAAVNFSDLPSQTFPLATQPNDYKLIAMNYLLTGNGTIDCELVLNNGLSAVKVNAAPVQINHRTNIYGSLLTAPAEFNITVDNEFATPDNDIAAWDGVQMTEVTPVKQTINGVETDVYAAAKASDLAWIANGINNGTLGADTYIQLSNDIDLNNKEWTPIANVSRDAANGEGQFTGTFDGNGKTVFNLVASSDELGVGLIGAAQNANIKNVTVSGGTLSSSDSAGAVLGYSNNCTIDNCKSEGLTITSTGAAGGIVGRCYGSTGDTVTNCVNSSTVTGTSASSKTGGIVGIVSYGTNTFTGCINSGNIDAPANNNAGTAGIAGYVGAPTTLTNCENSGNVGASTPQRTGGIVGYLNGNGPLTINSCTNSGKIIGVTVGGIFGMVGSYGVANITGCNNSGAIEATATAGGIVGQGGDGDIENCTNTASVTVVTANAGNAGGIVGILNRGNIYDCQGGSAAITALYAGRILGCANTGNGYSNDLKLISEGNSYEDGLRTVGSMANGTALSTLKILSGELIGAPAHPGGSNSVIIISEGASWNLFPDTTGSFLYNKTTQQWYKNS